jgi:DNA-binding MarR family transcriptional regulator
VAGKHSQIWWAKVTATVIHDAELSLSAQVVFCELALWWKHEGDSVSRGQRAIAEAINIHRGTVGVAILELGERGHIEIRGTGKQRRRYVLTSWVYREKVQAAVARRKAA